MNNERLIHGFKTMIAVIIGFSLTRIISFPYAQWIIISILVVMCAQLYVGSVFQKSYIRFLGTLCGCGIALVIIEIFHSSMWSILLGLAVASFIFSYIATAGKDTLSYFGTMGGVTLALILLGKRDADFDYAAARFLEIIIGIVIATLVSHFIFPIRAKNHLRKAQIETMQQLITYYNKIFVTGLTDEEQDLDEVIIQSLLKQRQLAKEAIKEPLGTPFDATHFAQSLSCERQLLRAMNFMHLAQDKLRHVALSADAVTTLQSFHTEVLAALTVIAENSGTLVVPTLENVRLLHTADKEYTLSEEAIYLDAIIFHAEIIVDGIRTLGTLYTA